MTTDERLSNSINQIRENTPRINTAVDQANRVVQEVENFLNRQNAAFPASVLVELGTREMRLECARIGDRFRIVVAFYRTQLMPGSDVAVSEPDGMKTWSECNRSDKLMSFFRLPDLLNQIAETMTTVLNRMDETMVTVKAVMNALSGPAEDAEGDSNPSNSRRRVFQIAKKLNVDSNVIIKKLVDEEIAPPIEDSYGGKPWTHMSRVSAGLATTIESWFAPSAV